MATMMFLKGSVFAILACMACANEHTRMLGKAGKIEKPTTPPTRSPVVTPFTVSPFSVMGVTHNAIRGWILQMEEDCLEAVENWTNKDKLNTAIGTIRTLLSLINPHMKQEDDRFYVAVDNTFSCATDNEGFREEHRADEAEQLVLTDFINRLSDPALTLSQAHEICAETFTFASDHEAHLKHEENILSPLTRQFPPGSPPAIVHHILITNFDSIRDYWFATALTQLVKRETLTVVGTYVAAVKHVLTKEQYSLILPDIMEACGEIWLRVEERLIGDAGEYTDADEAKLPAGIFDPPTCGGCFQRKC